MKGDLIICRCEEIGWAEIQAAIGEHDLKTMQEVKRVTRAGMGLCQGKTCARLVMEILAHETHRARSEITPDTSRPPVHPVPLNCFADWEADDDLLCASGSVE